jgi:predicted hotdog family 3-hydroxylacyl-ACP dehydratase
MEPSPVNPINIEDLIPHRDRMKLIHDVIDVNDSGAVTSSYVTGLWPLREGDFVQPIVLIEIVAQTAGIHIGWKKGLDEEAGGHGYIVGIKNADFFLDRIPLHTTLITTVKMLYGDGNYNVLEGHVTAGTDLIGRIQLQVFRSEAHSEPNRVLTS